MEEPGQSTLYDPQFEHDGCGVGFLADLSARPSHDLIEQGLTVLQNLLHRGAAGGDEATGDGAGLLLARWDPFFRSVFKALRHPLPSDRPFGVGLCFLPQDRRARETIERLGERVAAEEHLCFHGWRDVPINPDVLGDQARRECPVIRQCAISHPALTDPLELDRALYIFRKVWEQRVHAEAGLSEQFHVASLSCRTVVYKGLMHALQISEFYPDLRDPRLESPFVVVHQRYSTNTFPSWRLAQPFRYLAHNGEINTIRANRINMRMREPNLVSPLFGEAIRKIRPIIEEDGSDSASLDNALELLTLAGREIAHAAIMLIPQGWGKKYPMGPDLRGFFEYHSGLMEPWDGPAAIAFADGRYVGGLLDRNGLRPARYTVTRDGLILFASEAGVLDLPPERWVETGSLRPGQMILVDLEEKRLMKDGEIKMRLARRQPYRRWVEENRIELYNPFETAAPPPTDRLAYRRFQRLFGYTREDERMILNAMAVEGEEPKGSMGNDTPLAVLSERPQLLYDYFRQMFAQVTNPAIDPIREEAVMSLMTRIGNTDSILTETPAHARLIRLPHPFLSNEGLERLRRMPPPGFPSHTLPTFFPLGGNGQDLTDALEALMQKAVEAVREGVRILILSDRPTSELQAPIPMLMAVSAVHHRLIREGLRCRIGLLAETGEARDVNHMALLLSFGASAINPWFAYEMLSAMAADNAFDRPISPVEAVANYVQALCKGLLKIMSKMGISTLRSYRSAQLFEAIGLKKTVIDRYFPGTPNRIEGIGLNEIAHEIDRRVQAARRLSDPDVPLPSGGRFQLRRDGERHLWTPETITLLQRATRENRPDLYEAFARRINDQTHHPTTLRGLFRLRSLAAPIPLEEVEPASAIIRRFVTSAMSFGSLSPEAHETLAVAMNRLGAQSNSGEGGEDPRRYTPGPNGENRCSAVKQVASGRFGVTIEYLVNARELQIKIAQGAKPGEGGHLPGHKVNAEIARVRHSTPGVTLISPPPHHDIYSIEDIAELIFDLKNANPDARVSVKLVSEAGVGTVAAGVAKARADAILISGGDGGTGAAPLSSIFGAGIPWELGLAETQQTLLRNGLRHRVRLQVDGQMRTGRDVLIAALLGAEEFGFATAPLVVCGCVMMRQCHRNNCPVGVATQDPELRQRFSGRPEYVERYFQWVAEEVRREMARLGFHTLDELIGRTDLLEKEEAASLWKASGLDFSRLFSTPLYPPEARRFTRPWSHGLETVLDQEILRQARPALDQGRPVTVTVPIRNTHRAVGAMLSGTIARSRGLAGLPEDTITLRCQGTAGQSFAAFGARGVTFVLEGEANDYLGKGLSGAKVIVKPPPGATLDPSANVLAGNAVLYGATSGELYLNGRAGERFAVRNSGALAVVEGVGDHGCEYMTGGRVVVLGRTGINFGAGMSGGIAYVYDETGLFDERCNLEMIDLEVIPPGEDTELKALLERHVAYTGSPFARRLLANWSEALPFFIRVFPMEYRRALGRMSPDDLATIRKEAPHE